MEKNEELDDDLDIEAAMEDDGGTSGSGVIGTFFSGIINFVLDFFR